MSNVGEALAAGNVYVVASPELVTLVRVITPVLVLRVPRISRVAIGLVACR